MRRLSPLVVHVSPTGNDRGSGTAAAPFATVDRARHAVAAARRREPRRPVTVALHGGTYFLPKPVEFGPADGGDPRHPVVYTAAPGETPLLSGGQPITDWQETTHCGRRCWTAVLPDVKAGTWTFTQLFVNGVRRFRPRLPKTGFFHFADRRPADFPGGLVRHGNGPTHAYYRPGDLRAFHNLTDVKLVMYNAWYESHHRLKAIDEREQRVDFQSRGFSDGYTGLSSRYIVDNVFEALDTPGQWYLDRPTGTLSYLPLPDEQLDRVEVVAPRLPVLVRFAGTARRPVAHLRLERLGFAHAEWDYAPDCTGSMQAADLVPGAIQMVHAEHCVLFDCRVSQIAPYAIEVGRGGHDNTIAGCVFEDLGAGGVKVDHESLPSMPGVYDAVGADAARPRATTVADCVIRDGGKLFPSAVGVWIGNAGGNRVVHNRIEHLSYTGISCGWIWGYAPTRTHHNRIEHNEVHHIATDDLLHDLGGIYTLGRQPGSAIRGNHVHHIGGNGVYLDEGSSEILVEGNLIHHVANLGITLHYGQDNLVQQNVTAFSGLSHFLPGATEQHRGLVARRNAVYWTDGAFVWNPWGASDNWDPRHSLFSDNLLWDARGNHELDFGKGTRLADWQQLGQHLGTVIADPLFADPAGGDFSVRADSPLATLGIRPLDPATAGPRLKGCRWTWEEWQRRAAPRPALWLRSRWEQVDDGHARLVVENIGDKPASARLALRAGAGVMLDRSRVVVSGLRPGARREFAISFTAAPGIARWSLLETVPASAAVMPAAIHLAVAPHDWLIPRLGPVASPAAVAPALAGVPPRVIATRRDGPVATIQGAVAGDALAVWLAVRDADVRRGALAWEGSCVEVFGSPRPGGQWSPTQSNPTIRQVYLLPSAGNQPATARQQAGTEQPAPEIAVASQATPNGYEIAALIPLATLGLEAGQETFLLQVVVTATPVAGGGQQRAALFYGGVSASGSNLLYGLVRVGDVHRRSGS